MSFPSPGRLFQWIRLHPVLAAVGTVALLGLLKGVHDFAAELSIQMAAQLEPDAKIYFAAGRAVLNGINPYAELFENKPPLIFLLTALSLLVTGTQTIAAAVQVIMLACLPAAFAVFFARNSRGLPASQRFFPIAAGILLGLAIGRYAAVQAGYIQTESLGGIAGVLYLLLLIDQARWARIPRMLALGVLLFAAGAMKEPLLPVILATSLLFLHNRRQVVPDVLIPSGIAGALGVLLLAVFGWLGAYLKVYLPHMLFSHVDMRGSPWSRALRVDRLVLDLWQFSPFLCVALLLIAAAVAWDAAARRSVPVWKTAACGIVLAVVASFIVGLGGQYYPHHFIFALPLYAGLCFAWTLGDREDGWQSWSQPLILLITVLVSAGLLFQPLRRGIWTDPFWHGETEAAHRQAAAQFDRLMDACGYDRYLAFGADTEDLWAYSLHTTYSAAFTTYRLDLTEHMEEFAQMAAAQFQETPLILLHPSFRERLTATRLAVPFSETAPECAKSFIPLLDNRGEPYIVLFRR